MLSIAGINQSKVMIVKKRNLSAINYPHLLFIVALSGTPKTLEFRVEFPLPGPTPTKMSPLSLYRLDRI